MGFRTRVAPAGTDPWPAPPPWVAQALCAKVGRPADWHPADSDTAAIAAAVMVCRECPVRAACLEDAMGARGLRTGIWGGLTLPERRRLRRARTKAAKLPAA
ncbi:MULTISPECIES: WhiB family transcriptional regulator [Nocardiopsis]|uniref:WhiB family transcriptional regulator n=1 Tax=Nocardiopsis changdeensis TaxID=2831969 RepID=A0ABX8BVR8_9ACTN|nr:MULTISPECIES: WhiB family transcriptional regulator [Nocardiopsis]QUX26345.1 WhiB family transcriptional regulator [Nocardiopsis changdeensis]QYX40835.1 WhiB family transcriptional regulator [Nocardiopsis sp. MT53]